MHQCQARQNTRTVLPVADSKIKHNYGHITYYNEYFPGYIMCLIITKHKYRILIQKVRSQQYYFIFYNSNFFSFYFVKGKPLIFA